jgi:hypothetical protein
MPDDRRQITLAKPLDRTPSGVVDPAGLVQLVEILIPIVGLRPECAGFVLPSHPCRRWL